jgi:putative transcriptional regulator
VIEIRIEQLLEERGKTFYWLAKETGIGHTSLWRLRHEQAKSISFDRLERICRALECEPGDLFELVDDTRTSARARKAGTRKSRR